MNDSPEMERQKRVRKPISITVLISVILGLSSFFGKVLFEVHGMVLVNKNSIRVNERDIGANKNDVLSALEINRQHIIRVEQKIDSLKK